MEGPAQATQTFNRKEEKKPMKAMEKEWPGKWEDTHKRMALQKVKIE